jgi:hypothetical protein
MVIQTQSNTTPSELTFEQNQLLVAGSKISYNDIYQKQVGIPVVKGKYYKAHDVEKVFVDFNQILKGVSEHGHAQHRILTDVRQELGETQEKLVKTEADYEALKQKFDKLVREFGTKYMLLQQENEQLKQDYAQSEQARMELISQIN